MSETTTSNGAVAEQVQAKKARKAKAKTGAKKTAKKAAKKKGASTAAVDQASKEIRWTAKKVALLNALKSGGATKSTTAIGADRISKLSKGTALMTCEPGFDFVLQGYVGIANTEDQGNLRYITKKGLSKLNELSKVS